MYEVGKLDDMQKNDALEKLNNNELFLCRNVLNLLIFNLIYRWQNKSAYFDLILILVKRITLGIISV